MRSRSSPIGSRLAAAVISRAPPWSVLAATRAMGRAARVPLPRPLARAAVGTYSRMFDVDLDEVEPAVVAGGVRNFDEFFTRPLRTGARRVVPLGEAVERRTLTSPCDGQLRDAGPVLDARTQPGATFVEAKGFRYSIGTLLADDVLARQFEGGTHATIYLHPRDYHRVRAPIDVVVESVTAVPGRLLPVNDAALEITPRLFSHNERMVHVLRVGGERVAVVMVAAFGVGHMSCSYADLDPHPHRVQRHNFGDGGPALRRGDELGVFHLGSTVVLLATSGFGDARRLYGVRGHSTRVRVDEPFVARELEVRP